MKLLSADHVVVSTGKANIVGNVCSKTIFVRSSEGSISGVYNVSDDLVLKTKNKPISAWIIMNNNETRSTNAVLETTNAWV
jgi:hypothetical protein